MSKRPPAPVLNPRDPAVTAILGSRQDHGGFRGTDPGWTADSETTSDLCRCGEQASGRSSGIASDMSRSSNVASIASYVFVVVRLNYEIPDAVHREAKAAAALQGVTLRDFLIAALTEKVRLEAKERSGTDGT